MLKKKSLGAVIKEARGAQRFTQRELADQVGVKASHIAYIENGLRNPSFALLRRLADALGLSPRELLFLAHPEAEELAGNSEKPGKSAADAWREFSSNRVLLSRHQVTSAELKVLKQVHLLVHVADSRNLLFVLNAIRLAGNRGTQG